MEQKPVRITASEFRQHFGTYMEGVATTDYEVTRNGKVVGVWSNPNRNRMKLIEKASGMFDIDISDEEVERLKTERRLRRGNVAPSATEDDSL